MFKSQNFSTCKGSEIEKEMRGSENFNNSYLSGS